MTETRRESVYASPVSSEAGKALGSGGAASARQGSVHAARAASRQLGHPFKKGQSGNPAGMRPGTKHKATQLAEAIMEEGLRNVVDKVVAEARAGNMNAAKLILERIAPVRKGRPIEIDLPRVQTTADVLEAQSGIVEAVAAGRLTPEEGEIVSGIVDAKRRAIETADIERRLAALEKQQEQRK